MFKTINIKSLNYFLLAILILFLPLIHSDLFRYRFEETKFLVYDFTTTLITIFYFYQKTKISFSKLGMTVLILLSLMLLSMIQSVNIVYSLEEFLRFFNTTVLILFIYESLLTKQITLKRLLNLILLSSVFFMIYYFYGTMFGTKNIFSPIGHVNYTAHVFNIWIPLLLLNFWVQENKFFKYLSMVSALILVDILVMSGARGSLYGLILLEIVVIVAVTIKDKKIVLYPLLTLSIIGLYVIHKSYFPETLTLHTHRMEVIQPKIDYQNRSSNHKEVRHHTQKAPKNTTRSLINALSSNRINVYSNTLDMIIDNPLGVGMGNYQYIHPLYAKIGTPYATTYINEKRIFTNPHNIILKFLSELGWIGGSVFILLLFVLLGMVVSNIRRGDSIDYMLAIAFGANLFHAMLSAVFLTPVNILFTAVMTALIVYRYYGFNRHRSIFAIKTVYIKPFVFIMPLFFVPFFLSKYYTTQFTIQREAKYIYKAMDINPYNELAFFKAARYEAYAQRNYPLAIDHLDKFLKLYPYHLGGLIQKATFEYRLQRYDEALKSIDTVLLIDKKNQKMKDLRARILGIRRT